MPDGLSWVLWFSIWIVSCTSFIVIKKRSGFLIFAAQVLLSMLLEAVLWLVGEPADRLNYVVVLGVLAVSLLFWILDYTGKIFDPDNHRVQGHALWHVISSFCFIFLYHHYLQFA